MYLNQQMAQKKSLGNGLRLHTMVQRYSSLYLLQVDDEQPESLEGSDGVGEVLLGDVHLLDIPRDLLHLQRCTHKHQQ